MGLPIMQAATFSFDAVRSLGAAAHVNNGTLPSVATKAHSDPPYVSQLALTQTVFSSVCAVITLYPLLTVLCFPVMLKKKLFMHILMWMSICDFIGTVTFALGYPPIGPECTAQGAIMDFAYLALNLWSLLLSFQLYHLIMNGKPRLSLLQMHLVVWCTTLTLFVVPFTYISYGNDDDAAGKTPCTTRTGGTLGGNLMQGIVVYLPFLLFLILQVVWAAVAWCKTRNFEERFTTIRTALKMLWLYPLFLVLSWLPFILCNIYDLAAIGDVNTNWSAGFYVAFNLSSSWVACYGSLFSLAFFITSGESRGRWEDCYLRLRKHGSQTCWSSRDGSIVGNKSLLAQISIDFQEDDQYRSSERQVREPSPRGSIRTSNVSSMSHASDSTAKTDKSGKSSELVVQTAQLQRVSEAPSSRENSMHSVYSYQQGSVHPSFNSESATNQELANQGRLSSLAETPDTSHLQTQFSI